MRIVAAGIRAQTVGESRPVDYSAAVGWSRIRTLAGGCAAVAALALASPAHAAFPGANGLLAFNSDIDGDFELFTMRADGMFQTQRTDNSVSDRKPVWSPDGTRLAFMSNRDNDFDIYVMDLDGDNLIQLTLDADHPANDFNPAWSPDGRLIAFNSDRTGDFEIYVIAAGGGTPVRLTRAPGVDSVPAFSPDGRWIAFESSRTGNAEVFLMHPDGTGQHRVTRNPAADLNPSWSPDGERLAFTSDRDGTQDIWVMKWNGGNAHNLTANLTSNPANPADDRNAAWSPDGRLIAFASNRDGDFEIFSMGSNGGAPTQLTHNAKTESIPDWQRLPGGSSRSRR